MWRINRAMPERGVIVIFNRSHYEDVLTVQVHQMQKEYMLAPRKNRKMHMRILNHKGRIISNFPHYIFSGASNPSTEMQSSITFLVSSSSAIQPAFFVSSSSVRIFVS